jgi:hypothetical protein
MLAYVIPRHEPWADEAQAWELVGSLSLKDLFGRYIHYECSPGLWHALLWLIAKLHITYGGMHWLVGLLAVASVSLLSIYAPFPLIFRLLLPFTFFLAFQYAVIARSYSLFPPLLFVMAALWKRKWRHPLLFALLLGLLANVSLHGLAVAVGITTVLAIEWYREPEDKPHGWQMGVAALLTTAMTAFAVWCIWPVPDAGWAIAAERTKQNGYGLIDMVGHSYQAHPWMHSVRLRYGVFLGLLFNFTQSLGRGLSEHFNLGIIAWALLLWGWARRRLLRYTIPVFFLALVSPAKYSQIYHAGLMWILFLFLWWVTWQQQERAVASQPLEEMQIQHYALVTCIALCIGFQLSKGIEAARYDALNPYSPNRAGAGILRDYLNNGYKVDVAVPSRLKADGDAQFYAVGLEPYFTNQPISNMPFRFWFLGGDADVRQAYLEDASRHRAIVLVEETADDPRYKDEEQYLTGSGYRRGPVVCGEMFGMGRAPQCHAFYVPPGVSRSAQ